VITRRTEPFIVYSIDRRPKLEQYAVGSDPLRQNHGVRPGLDRLRETSGAGEPRAHSTRTPQCDFNLGIEDSDQ